MHGAEMDFLPKRVKVQEQASSSLILKRPEMDLCPEDVFKALYKKPPSFWKIPMVEIVLVDKSVLRGILVHAKEWNPLPGWWRVSLAPANVIFVCCT